MPSHRLHAFLAGCRGAAPILLGVVPFGLIYGVVVNNAHISGALGQAMSTIIFAGSAQLITAQLFGEATPALIIIATGLIVNLRHLLYSASIAPLLEGIGTGWKWLLSYLLTDEAYAVVVTHFETKPDVDTNYDTNYRKWYFLGTGMALWGCWHLCTALGIFVGGQIPGSWGLDFSVPLTFIALVVPAIRDRAGAAAMLAAGVAALLLTQLPLRLGLLTSILVGIAVGYIVDAFANK